MKMLKWLFTYFVPIQIKWRGNPPPAVDQGLSTSPRCDIAHLSYI